MGLALPPETFRSYVQVNLYGASLRSIQQRGIDIPQLLACVGFSHCVMKEIPLFSEEIQRHLDCLNPLNHTGNVTECPVEPNLEPTREIKTEEILDDGTRPLTESVRHSTPITHKGHVLLNCSLSTIHSDIDGAFNRLHVEPSSLSITTSALPDEASSRSVTPGETTVEGNSKTMVPEGPSRPDDLHSVTILALMNDLLDRVQSEMDNPVAILPVITPPSDGEEDFFDCESDIGINSLDCHADPPNDPFPSAHGSPIDLPPLKKCHSNATPRSPPPKSHRDASLPNIKISFPPVYEVSVKQEYDSVDATADAYDFLFEDGLGDLGSVKEESAYEDVLSGVFDEEMDRSVTEAATGRAMPKENTPSAEGGDEEDECVVSTEPQMEAVMKTKQPINTEQKTTPPRTGSDEEEEEFYFSDVEIEDAEGAPVKKRAKLYPDYDIARTVKCHFQSCGKEFKWRRKYGTTRFMNHVRTHYNGKTWKCRLCDFKAKTDLYVQRHHRATHPGFNYEKAVNCASKTDHSELMQTWKICFPGCRQPVHVMKENVEGS